LQISKGVLQETNAPIDEVLISKGLLDEGYRGKGLVYSFPEYDAQLYTYLLFPDAAVDVTPDLREYECEHEQQPPGERVIAPGRFYLYSTDAAALVLKLDKRRQPVEFLTQRVVPPHYLDQP